ncbi:hypothetical protein ILYODFUR_009827 [Ilyodon furcidens]|uniref:Uncharacterized protein n=1 Tax=Ilyodon furcidens TaxID=33524 RepID=A0ABV0VFV7_9TELE
MSICWVGEEELWDRKTPFNLVSVSSFVLSFFCELDGKSRKQRANANQKHVEGRNDSNQLSSFRIALCFAQSMFSSMPSKMDLWQTARSPRSDGFLLTTCT